MIVGVSIIFGGLFCVGLFILIAGNRLGNYLKEKHPIIYQKNIAQHGVIVDTVTPNIFLFSGDASELAKEDNRFKILRRHYGIAWLMLPTWLIVVSTATVLIFKYL